MKVFSSFKKFFFTGKANTIELLQKGGCFQLAYVVNNNYTVAYFSIVFDICVFYNFRIIQIAATIGISLTGSCIINTRLFSSIEEMLKEDFEYRVKL